MRRAESAFEPLRSEYRGVGQLGEESFGAERLKGCLGGKRGMGPDWGHREKW